MFKEYKPWEREVQHSLLTGVILVCHAYWFSLDMRMCNCHRAKMEWSLSQLSWRYNLHCFKCSCSSLEYVNDFFEMKKKKTFHSDRFTSLFKSKLFPPFSGPFLWSSVWWGNSYRNAASESRTVHMHQCQQGGEVSTDTLPELVSFQHILHISECI